jgi:hypothetical protein
MSDYLTDGPSIDIGTLAGSTILIVTTNASCLTINVILSTRTLAAGLCNGTIYLVNLGTMSMFLTSHPAKKPGSRLFIENKRRGNWHRIWPLGSENFSCCDDHGKHVTALCPFVFDPDDRVYGRDKRSARTFMPGTKASMVAKDKWNALVQRG